MCPSSIKFQDEHRLVYADTCEPLKAAAQQGAVALWAWSRGAYPGLRLPKMMLPELRSVGVWDAPRPQAWGLAEHCNEGIELTYLARGKLAFAVEKQAYWLHKGHFTLTRPWQWHRVGAPHVAASCLIWLIVDVGVRRPNQAWQWPAWLVLSAADLRQLTEMLRHNEAPVWQANPEIAHSFTDLAHLLQQYKPQQSETRLKLAINALLVAIFEMLRDKRVPLDEHLSSTQRTVEIFLDALPKRLGQDWTLDAMASECGLARSQFAAYCRRLTNMTPGDYLTHCRLERAAALLREAPALSVTDIAFACGFNSSQYFATVFRARFGCAPTDYRHTPDRD